MKKSFLQRTKEEFLKKTTTEKIVTVATAIICVAILVLMVLQITETWADATDLYILLIGIMNIFTGYNNRKIEGGLTKLSYGTGIFIIVLWVINMILKWIEL